MGVRVAFAALGLALLPLSDTHQAEGGGFVAAIGIGLGLMGLMPGMLEKWRD